MGHLSPLPKRGRDTGGRALGNLFFAGPWVDLNRAGTVSGLPAKGYAIVTLAGPYELSNGSRTEAKPPVTWHNR